MTLIERIESAEGPDRELDCMIAETAGGWYDVWHKGYMTGGYAPNGVCEGDIPKYTADLNAALTLLPDDRPNWAVTGKNSATVGTVNGVPGAMTWVFAATPALALVAAILRALDKEAGK